eukprot:symbB.v1.2.003361.t1/scaffold186.1/size279346/8
MKKAMSASRADSQGHLARRSARKRLAPRAVEFTVGQYNILAGYLGINMQPWFLYGVHMPEERRQRIFQMHREKLPNGEYANLGWPKYVTGILSDEEIRRVEEIHNEHFAWEKRRWRLLEVIRGMKCDLLSLVECDHYEDHFKAALLQMGYDSIWRKRPRASSADGCCVAWRSDLFELLKEENVEFIDKTCPVQGNTFKDRIALIALLRQKSSRQKICLVSTHLQRNPEDLSQEMLRAKQVGQVLRALVDFASKHAVFEVPVVLAGDLNCSSFGRLRGVANTLSLLDRHVVLHPFTFDAADVPLRSFTSLTHARKLRIDAIVYQCQRLELVDVHESPEDSLHEVIPNARHPSDHVPIVARFRCRPQRGQETLRQMAKEWFWSLAGIAFTTHRHFWLKETHSSMGNAVPGSCAIKEEKSAFQAEQHVLVHQYLFPMYVVKVSDFLQMRGVPEPHHVLKQKGLLHEWQPGMFVIFISHQWLGFRMPDPAGLQVAVLRSALRGLMDQTLKVEADMTQMDFGKATSYEQVADGYLFLDWFAIPQITARSSGVNEDMTRSDAALAVQSIPAYVEACDMFVALVPDLFHFDTSLPCNYTTWLSRGWCRAELWCRLLSTRRDTSVIVIFSAREALYMFPLDWQKNLISDGLFTVESDREDVVNLGEMALASKIEHLRAAGPLAEYRFYLARRSALLNVPPEEWDLKGFLDHFGFSDVEAAVKQDTGLTGILCATLAGNLEMLRVLVQNQADPNGRCDGLVNLGYYDTQTVLMVAAKSHQDPCVLSTLIELRADPGLVSRSGITAMWLALEPGHVQALLEGKADLFAFASPLNGIAGRASTATVRMLLESRCDASRYSLDGFGALHAVPFFSRANRHACETTKLLISFRADVNMRAEPKGPMFWECFRARVHTAIFWLGSLCLSKKACNHSWRFTIDGCCCHG